MNKNLEQDKKINIVFRKSVLKSILQIILMEHPGFRNIKFMRNIHKLFDNINMIKYKNNPDLISYIWCIKNSSKLWLDGITNSDLIYEGLKRLSEFDGNKASIIEYAMQTTDVISSAEVRMINNLVMDAIQYGYIVSKKDDYLSILEDIDVNDGSSYRSSINKLFKLSQSLLEIKRTTSVMNNSVTFNSSDIDSVKESIDQTIDSLGGPSSVMKTGIKRLNTLLSPGYMNGRIYVYAGLPGCGKSMILLKTALDIRKYNPNFINKTPDMKPCVLYITMENSFTETIERIWNMTFDDSIANYSKEEALEKITTELGINTKSENNIEIVIKYFPYREICTDDLYTIIQDLRDQNLEVVALVFDYLKRIRPNDTAADNVKLELNRIINELKSLAVINDIPVITAHQMNRAAASTVDAAVRQGKGDVTKLVGRENTGDAWEIVETADWVTIVNIEYKPNTDERFMIFNNVKRRRLNATDDKMNKYTYIAHPFSKGMKLIDDIYMDNSVSVQSLITDMPELSSEKVSAVKRLKNAHNDFDKYKE